MLANHANDMFSTCRPRHERPQDERVESINAKLMNNKQSGKKKQISCDFENNNIIVFTFSVELCIAAVWTDPLSSNTVWRPARTPSYNPPSTPYESPSETFPGPHRSCRTSNSGNSSCGISIRVRWRTATVPVRRGSCAGSAPYWNYFHIDRFVRKATSKRTHNRFCRNISIRKSIK